MREISEKMYMTSDGLKFLDKDEAKKNQDNIDRSTYFAIKVREGPDTRPGIFQSLLMNYTHKEPLSSVYVGVMPIEKEDPSLMLEEFMYEEYGHRIGYLELYGRFPVWEYEEVSHKAVFSDVRRSISIVDEDLMRVLRELRRLRKLKEDLS